MSTDDNKAVVRRWFDEVISRGDMGALDAICAECHPQFAVIRGVIEPAPLGMSGLKSLITSLRSAFPDLHAEVEEQIAEGDKVAFRWSATATHRGNGLNFAATGRPVSFSGMGVLRVNHNLETSRRHFGQVVSTHSYEDRVRTIETAKAAGFDIHDLFGRGGSRKGKGTVAVKYRDKAGNTWTGRAS